MNDWSSRDARNRFSELVRKSRLEGPQRVMVRGKPAVVFLSIDDYKQLIVMQRTSSVDGMPGRSPVSE